MDNRLLVPEWRRIQFSVKEDSFGELPTKLEMNVDLNLFDQAVNNVLDNAGKYSYSGTTVYLVVGTDKKKQRFYISFYNKGHRLEQGQNELAKQRGWRSPLAEDVTGEGSGIGLWIVDHIMKAHGGDLVIATNAAGITEFRLVFPASEGTE